MLENIIKDMIEKEDEDEDDEEEIEVDEEDWEDEEEEDEDRERTPAENIVLADNALKQLSEEWLQNQLGDKVIDVMMDALNDYIKKQMVARKLEQDYKEGEPLSCSFEIDIEK